ncbi:hypothetical protein GCM10009547_48120 [Sporichthya brevicatena]|uniref:Uncharacterized protein n=2 Tax=Sporichthya brevicatena TaxID=171442 RepID=A0ABP3SGX5_9ACTN
MTVVTEFFQNEFNEHVASVLRRELDAGRQVELTFNVFNVRLDPQMGVVTVQDELDPNRCEALDLAEFAGMVEERSRR